MSVEGYEIITELNLENFGEVSGKLLVKVDIGKHQSANDVVGNSQKSINEQ